MIATYEQQKRISFCNKLIKIIGKNHISHILYNYKERYIEKHSLTDYSDVLFL